MAGQFPTDPMMGPSSPLGVINPKTPVQGPGGFEQFLNALREVGRTGADKISTKTGTRVAGLAAPLAYGAGSLMGGDIAQGVGEIGGGLLGSQLVGGIASDLASTVGGRRGKLLGAGVRLAGGLLGGGIGGGIASTVGGGIANAAQALTGGAAQREMARGESPGLIPGISPGTGIGFSDADVKRIEELSRITGQSQVDIARQMLPLSNQYRDAEMQRQMQLNQQTGQITGALNRQLYTAQLASGAQAQAGETTRTMMTAANPYAASAFQYRG